MSLLCIQTANYNSFPYLPLCIPLAFYACQQNTFISSFLSFDPMSVITIAPSSSVGSVAWQRLKTELIIGVSVSSSKALSALFFLHNVPKGSF